jgi:hypothetical protein
MTTSSISPNALLSALALSIALAAPAAEAQTSTRTPQRPAKPLRKPPPKPPAAPAPPLVLAPAGGEQLAAAAMTHFGDYACEFEKTLHVSLNAQHEGYVDVRFGTRSFTTKPLLSSTGALRLEDVAGRMLLLQIAVKSMLMDVQSGRRIVDECVHEKHLQARRALEAAPPQPGLGIDPERTAAAAAAAAAAADAAKAAAATPAPAAAASAPASGS